MTMSIASALLAGSGTPTWSSPPLGARRPVRLGARFGPHTPIKAGLLVTVAGLGALLTACPSPDATPLPPVHLLVGAGLGMPLATRFKLLVIGLFASMCLITSAQLT